MYTQQPNEFYDTLMTTLTRGELLVYLYICRRTFGFHKEADAIPLRQFTDGITTKDGRRLDRGAGLSRRQVLYAVKSLEERGVITVERRPGAASVYRCNALHPPRAMDCTPPVQRIAPHQKKSFQNGYQREEDTKEYERRVVNS